MASPLDPYRTQTLASIRHELAQPRKPRRAPAIGDRSGRLVVIAPGPRPRTVQCRCDCGATVTLANWQIGSGDKTHCGCGPRSWAREGERHGKLTVVARSERGRWACQCDCGRTVTRGYRELSETGHCGCSRARAERASRALTPAAAGYVVTGPMTCEEIAVVLGLSRQRVQQIEREALAKLRESARGLLDEGEVTRATVPESMAGTRDAGEAVRVSAGEEEIGYRLDILGPRVGAYCSVVDRAYSRRLETRFGVAKPRRHVTSSQRIYLGRGHGRAA